MKSALVSMVGRGPPAQHTVPSNNPVVAALVHMVAAGAATGARGERALDPAIKARVLLLQMNGVGTALIAATVTQPAAIVHRPAIAAGVPLHKPVAVETRQVLQTECAPLEAGPGAGATVPICAQRTRRALRAPRAWTVAGAATFVSVAPAADPSTERAITSGSGYPVIVPLTNALRTRLAVGARN
jgi:hypothetical protein